MLAVPKGSLWLRMARPGRVAGMSCEPGTGPFHGAGIAVGCWGCRCPLALHPWGCVEQRKAPEPEIPVRAPRSQRGSAAGGTARCLPPAGWERGAETETASCVDREGSWLGCPSGCIVPPSRRLWALSEPFCCKASSSQAFVWRRGKEEGMEAALRREIPERWSEQGAVIWVCR